MCRHVLKHFFIHSILMLVTDKSAGKPFERVLGLPISVIDTDTDTGSLAAYIPRLTAEYGVFARADGNDK